MAKAGTPEALAAARAAGLEKAFEDAKASTGVTEEELEAEGTPTPEEPEGLERPEGEGNTEETETTLDDFPEDYFGTNIRAYAEEHGVEAGKVYQKALEDANRVANSKWQEIAEARKQLLEEASKNPAPTPEPLTEEQLLESVGIDPQILEYEDLGKPIVQLAKLVAKQNEQLEQVARETGTDKAEREFFGTFNELEGRHGKLPAEWDKDALVSLAEARQVFDPEALYWMVAGPVKSTQAPVPAKPQGPTRDFKKQISGLPRRAANPDSTQQKKPVTLQEHFEAAKKQLQIPASQDPFAWPE